MNIVRAWSADLPTIRHLLESEGLPGSDLSEQLFEHFLVIREAGQLQGTVGLEVLGNIALLRSLAVTRNLRKQGYGAALTAAAEALAAQLEIQSLYLLTTSAESFFKDRGFRRIARADAPALVKATMQFGVLCPSTAILMVKP